MRAAIPCVMQKCNLTESKRTVVNVSISVPCHCCPHHRKAEKIERDLSFCFVLCSWLVLHNLLSYNLRNAAL